MHKYKIHYFVPLLWSIVVTLFSLVSIQNVGVSIPIKGKDKIVHFIFYFIMMLLWCLAQKKTTAIKNITILIVVVLYGGLIEILQSFTSFRTADFYDFIANTAGALLGFTICQRAK